MPDARDDLCRTYSLSLLVAGRRWRRVADRVARAHGLSDATAVPLVAIARMAGEPRQTALAEAVGIEGPTLVRLLDQLCELGFVQRREDPADRRAKVIGLTPAGVAVVRAIEADLADLRRSTFTDVAPADLEASLRVFQALEGRLRAVEENEP